MPVPEKERQSPGVDRDLVEGIGVITVERLPGRIGPGGVVGALLDRIEGTRSADDRTAGGEAPLLLNLARPVRGRTRRHQDCRQRRQEGGERIAGP